MAQERGGHLGLIDSLRGDPWEGENSVLLIDPPRNREVARGEVILDDRGECRIEPGVTARWWRRDAECDAHAGLSIVEIVTETDKDPEGDGLAAAVGPQFLVDLVRPVSGTVGSRRKGEETVSRSGDQAFEGRTTGVVRVAFNGGECGLRDICARGEFALAPSFGAPGPSEESCDRHCLYPSFDMIFTIIVEKRLHWVAGIGLRGSASRVGRRSWRGRRTMKRIYGHRKIGEPTTDGAVAVSVSEAQNGNGDEQPGTARSGGGLWRLGGGKKAVKSVGLGSSLKSQAGQRSPSDGATGLK